MKATIEIPDELYRRVKAEAAWEGRPIREVTIELYRRWLEEDSESANEADSPPAPSLHDRLEKYCGIVHSGRGDLSTNPAHMEGFGED
jgi:hypothetical protein